MFSFFNKKNVDVSSVHPEVGATLTRATAFPDASAPAALPLSCTKVALKGVPPQAALVDEYVEGETTAAHIIQGEGRAPLAVVTVNEPAAHIELWELTDQRAFARKRTARLDADQEAWVMHLLSDVACLPGARLIVGVYYYAPQVKEAVYVYDIAASSFVKLANVAPDIDALDRLFTAQPATADTAIVLYNTGRVRTAPEQYYNSFNHLVLFTPRYPAGFEILKLAAADGSVRRWSVIDKTLWLATTDRRDPRKPTDFVWSLDLSKVL